MTLVFVSLCPEIDVDVLGSTKGAHPGLPLQLGVGSPVQPLVAACRKKKQLPGFSAMVVMSGSMWPVLAAASRLPRRLTSGAQSAM